MDLRTRYCPNKVLAGVLSRLQVALKADATATRRSPTIRPLIKDALRHLKTGAMKILLRDPPRTPLIEFALTIDALSIVSALISFVIITDLIDLGYHELWVLSETEDAVWPRVLQWTGYLLPLNSGLSLSSFPPLSIMSEAFDTIICIFDRLSRVPSERARPIVLSGGHNAIHDIVTLWLNSAALLGENKDAEGELRLSSCCRLLSALWPVLGVEEEMRAILVAYIVRAVKGHPRRLFRIISSHVDALAKQLNSKTWTDMGQLLWPMIALALSPELHSGGFPRCMIRSGICILRVAIADYPGLCPTSHDVLCKLCSHDFRALLFALDLGLFATLVDLRATGTCEDFAVKEMTEIISFALVFPRAVQHFHDGLPEGYRLSDTACHPNEQELLKLADERFEMLQKFRANEFWCRRRVLCVNINCTGPRSTGLRVLRACPCGDALYCSRSCQRLHWNSDHKTSCALEMFVDEQTAPLKLRDLNFLQFLSYSYMSRNYTRFVAELNGAPPFVTLDLSASATFEGLQALDFDAQGMQPTAIVRVIYVEENDMRSRVFRFEFP